MKFWYLLFLIDFVGKMFWLHGENVVSQQWILKACDNDISLFIDFKEKKKGFVTYRDKNKSEILRKGSVGNPSSTTISDILLIYV